MPYIELHAHSNFSFLEGASHVEELVLRALRRQDYALAKSAALTTGMLAMTSQEPPVYNWSAAIRTERPAARHGRDL